MATGSSGLVGRLDAGQLVRTRRKHYGLEQTELARLAGTSQGQISRIERGEVSPTVRTLEKLLVAMGDQLVLGTGQAFLDRDPEEVRDVEVIFYGETVDEDFPAS